MWVSDLCVCHDVIHIRVVQLVGSEPCEALQPKVGELLADSDKNKQRAAAELLAGMLNGNVMQELK